MKQPRALLFDVFGTVVDWRSGIVRELQAFGTRHGIDADWPAVADGWRSLYQPSMEDVRTGRRPFTILDQLHRESLETLLRREGIDAAGEEAVDDLNRAWHRLDPWPDSVEGLTRLKRNHVIATLSNGNIALLVDMAKHGGLPWDAVLGAETSGAYKPQPQAYLRTAGQLGLAPDECMMVAAHNGDLEAARALGFMTAFIRRPEEHGPEQVIDLEPTGEWDFVGDSMIELADMLG